MLFARDDIQDHDRALEKLQFQKTQLELSFEQILTSSSEILSLHVTLLDQHLDLQARHRASVSALDTSQAQLQEIQATYDKLAAQVSEEDPLLKDLYDYFEGDYPTHRLDDAASDLCKLRSYLWPDLPDWYLLRVRGE